MILVVASRLDEAAARLPASFPAGTVRLLTPRDMSLPGWELDPADPRSSVAVASGRRLEATEVSGVLCLLPDIMAEELIHIGKEDRAYVAAEMTAFLSFWLSCLQCAKLNRPFPGCLSGPRWTRERWLRTAADIGLPTVPFRRSTREGATPAQPSSRRAQVMVVGERALGHEDPEPRAHARALASAAGVDLLVVVFARDRTGYAVCGVEPFPELAGAEATAAIRAFFEGRNFP